MSAAPSPAGGVNSAGAQPQALPAAPTSAPDTLYSRGKWMLILLAILLPPVAVFLKTNPSRKSYKWVLFSATMFTGMGYIPGIVFAIFYTIFSPYPYLREVKVGTVDGPNNMPFYHPPKPGQANVTLEKSANTSDEDSKSDKSDKSEEAKKEC